jgi:cell wall assembly regulator SMI1
MIEIKINHWKKKEIAINTGASDDDIKSLEECIDFKFPDEFVTFYKSINGFKDRDWTPNMFSLFPLDRIK